MSTELCDRMKSVLTPQQFESLDSMTNEELRCLGEYGNLLRGNSTGSHSLLLKLLQSVSENNANVEDEDLAIFGVNNVKTAHRRRAVETEQNSQRFQRMGGNVSLELCGNGKLCADPAALQISKGLHHLLTTLVLKDVHIPVEILKKALDPCIVLQDLTLDSVRLLPQCERIVADGTAAASYGPVELPGLSSFTFRCSADESDCYSWNTIFFFAIAGAEQVSLEKLWKCQLSVKVECGSMILNLDPERQSVFLQLYRKEFYDSPRFVPCIEPESVLGFLEECSGAKAVTFLLPKGFESIDLCRLPYNTKSICLSGLDLKCSEEQSYFKEYMDVKLMNCSFNQHFLDNVSVIFSAAKRIELEGCRLNNTELVNYKFVVSS